jgi:hypothetical protein
MHVLAWLIGVCVMMLIVGLVTAVIVGGVMLFRDANGPVQIFMGIFAALILGTVGAIFSTVILSWAGLVPIVVCMEADKQGVAALGRAYDLLRGHWIRITSLMALVGFAILALYLILLGTMALVLGLNNIKDLTNGRLLTDSTFIIFLIAFGGTATLLGLFYTPLYQLILTVFYLDVRVRQEALDLEWTAHTTAPAENPAQVAAAVAISDYLPQQPSPAGTRPLDTPVTSKIQPVSPFEVSTLSSTPAEDFIDAQPRSESTPAAAPPAPHENEPPRSQW